MTSKELFYTIFSGDTSEIGIVKIDRKFAEIPVSAGGLRWKFLDNNWLLKKKFLWQNGLLNVSLKGDFDVFIFLGSPYFLSTWVASLIARLRGKRVYFWMHGVYKDKLFLVDRVKLFVFYKIATGFFLYGHRAADIINQFKIKEAKHVHVIYNSLDYRKSLEFRKDFSFLNIPIFRRKYFGNDRVPVVVFIGRLNSIKKLDMLIEAQALLRDRFEKVFFNVLIIGDGEVRRDLESQALGLGLSEHVCFLGAVFDEGVNSYCLMNSDLCVTPGEVGLTCIHSLSYGTPVISHNNLNVQMPEVEAIIPGITGDLYDYGSLESLSDSIHHWLTKYPIKNDDGLQNCYGVIDKKYNPIVQSQIFDSVLK